MENYRHALVLPRVKRWITSLHFNWVKRGISNRKGIVGILVLALLVLQLGKGISWQRMKSPCFDEPLHIRLGLDYWKQQDYSYGFTNPTLPQRIIALPQVLFHSDDTAYLWLWHGRSPVFIQMVLLGGVLFVWVRGRAGDGGAFIALVLYAFCPNILAHGSIAGTDMPAAAAFFVSLICYIALMRQITLIRLVAAGSALGVLFTTKLVAFFLLPTLLALGIFRSIDVWPLHMFGKSLTGIWQKSLALIVLLLILGGCVVGAIWGVYGFQYRDSRGDELSSWDQMEATDISAPLRWAATHRVLPEGYLVAIHMMSTVKNTGYLRGETSYDGWWWYFPYALLVKTPIPTLFCFLFSIGAAIVQLSRFRDESSVSLDIPKDVLEWIGLTFSVFCYLGISMISPYNVGIRLMLPIYPCLIALVGLIAPHLKKSQIFRYTICVLLTWLGFTFVYQSQDPVAYFNEFAGGSKNGYKHLVDSNLDWGQDLPLLAEYLEGQEDQEIWLEYFGTLYPSIYDINFRGIVAPYAQPQSTDVVLEPLSGGLYVVSLTHLFGGYILDDRFRYPMDTDQWMTLHRKVSLYDKGLLEPETENVYKTTYGASPTKQELLTLRGFQGIALLNRLKKREPDDRIGYTMFVYQLSDEDIANLTSP